MTEELSYEQWILQAADHLNWGEPLRDWLTDEEIETAVEKLAMRYGALGIKWEYEGEENER